MLHPNSSVNLHDHKVARRPQSEKLKNCTSCYCAENSSGSAVTPISRTVLNQKKKTLPYSTKSKIRREDLLGTLTTN